MCKAETEKPMEDLGTVVNTCRSGDIAFRIARNENPWPLLEAGDMWRMWKGILVNTFYWKKLCPARFAEWLVSTEQQATNISTILYIYITIGYLCHNRRELRMVKTEWRKSQVDVDHSTWKPFSPTTIISKSWRQSLESTSNFSLFPFSNMNVLFTSSVPLT